MTRNKTFIFLSILFLAVVVLFSPEKIVAQTDTEVIRTTTGLDEMNAPLPLEQTQIPDLPQPPAVLDRDELIRVNRSLKNSIEENAGLMQRVEEVEKQLGTMRGERQVEKTRTESLIKQRDQLSEDIRQLKKQREEIAIELEKMKAAYIAKEKEIEERIAEFEKRLAKEEQWREEIETIKAPIVIHQSGARAQELNQDIFRQIDVLNVKNEELASDTAKAHYNMGNAYFKKGRYKDAIAEYEKALALTPHDADTHYNIAFVKSEFLHRYKEALPHYQKYLYLRPNAEDRSFVEEKIIEANLEIDGSIDSPLEEWHYKQKYKLSPK